MTPFLLVIEILFAVLVIGFILTQVLVPFLEGRKMFPLFHPQVTKRERDLRDKLEEVAQKEVEAELESELMKREENLNSSKRKS